MRQGKLQHWSENAAQYSLYTEQFAYPLKTAMERRYVYFGELEKKYPGADSVFDTDVTSNLISTWKNIFQKAKQLQEDRERNFINNAKNYLGSLTPDERAMVKTLKSKSGINETMETMIAFFQGALVNSDVAKLLRDHITFVELTEAFNMAVNDLSKKIGESIADAAMAEQLTAELDDAILDNLIKVIQKKGTNESAAAATKLFSLKGSQLVFDMFKTLGYIRESNFKGHKSQITKFLETQLADPNREKMFNGAKFKSSLIGIGDELIGVLSHELKKNKTAEINYSGTTKGSSKKAFQKTDISITVPDLKKKLPDIQINISAKAATFADGGKFLIPAKFAEKSMLATKYKDIENYLDTVGRSGISNSDLNSLFFVINNEVIRNQTMLDIPMLLDILSYISFIWMFNTEDFQEIKNGSRNLNILNLFEIGGQIIPSSVIFSLMEKSLQAKEKEKPRIVGVNINPPTKSLSYDYYVDAHWQKTREDMMRTGDKTIAWDKARDWVEREGKMGFFLKSNNIFDILNLKSKI